MADEEQKMTWVVGLRDHISGGLESMANRARRLKDAVSGAFSPMERAAKPIKTFADASAKACGVMDELGKRLDEVGALPSQVGQALDSLERHLESFIRTGEGADDLLERTKKAFAAIGASKADMEGLIAPVKSLVKEVKAVGQAAEDTGKQTQSVSAAMTRSFRAIRLATGAINGNFYSLARVLALLGDKFKFLGIGGGLITGIGAVAAAVGGVVTAFKRWRDKAEETRKKLAEIKEQDFEAHLKRLRDAQRELNEEMGKTVSEIDKKLSLDQRDLELIREKTKAQIELNRQMALKGKSAEEQAGINDEYDRAVAAVDSQAALDRVGLQIIAAQSKAAELRRILDKYEGTERQYTTVTTNTGRKFVYSKGDDLDKLLNGESVASAKGETRREGGEVARLQTLFNAANTDEAKIYNKLLNDAVKKRVWEKEWQLEKLKNAPLMPQYGFTEEVRANQIRGLEQELALDRQDALQRIPHSADFKAALLKDEDYQKARKHVQSLKTELEAIYKARDKVREALNDAVDSENALRQAQEIEERKADIAVEVEERKQERIAKVREEAARRESAAQLAAQQSDVAALLASAQGRLAAAQSQVAQAWGWYRNKGSLRGQITEWEADAKARQQYEKDYRHLTHGRTADLLSEATYLQRHGHEDRMEERIGEWRRKKMLSLNEEATMRYALAQDKERQARSAVIDIDETLHRIEKSLADVLTMEG